MKKLVIFWKHFEMSNSVAKKGSYETRQYKIEPRKSEFPFDKNVDEAILEIYNEYGKRPEIENPCGKKPFEGSRAAHSFAEIVGHKITGEQDDNTNQG